MAGAVEVEVAAVLFGSTAEKLGIEQGFDITQVEVPADRPAKEWAFIPAMLLLSLIVVLQRARAGCEKKVMTVPADKPA